MIHKTIFGSCRKHIAVLALSCVILASCGGTAEHEKADGTNVSTVSTGVVTTIGEASAIVENTTGENVIIHGGEVPLTEEITVTVAPDATEETEFGADKSGDKEPASTVKTSGTTTTVKDATTVTTKPRGDVVKDTETTATTPLVQVLPDGGLLLPDDEWD